MKRLAVGRIVHVHTEGKVLAGIVTEIEDDKSGRVRLSVLTGSPQLPIEVRKGVEYSKDPVAGAWSWPVKDAEKK